MQLSEYMKNMSNYKFKLNIGHDWNTIKNNIYSKRMPCLSLRSSKSISNLAWHYRVIIGTKTTVSNVRYRFLWWTWTSRESTDWYYMHDNGSDGENFWELKGKFYQLESANVCEK